MWQTKDGLDLFCQRWLVPDATADILIIHGIGDHGGRFWRLAGAYNRAGWNVTAIDWRGNGRSQGVRGHVEDFEQVQEDLLDSYKAIQASSELPCIAHGQSLGGLLALKLALDVPDRFAGCIASSPALAVAVPIPAWKLWTARSIGAIWPQFSLPTGIRTTDLSRCSHLIEEFDLDDLRHRRITARTFFGMLDLAESCLARASDSHLPILIQHGTGDRVTGADGSREFAARCGHSCDLKLWPGMLHELHHEELDKSGLSPVHEYLCEWIRQCLASR